MKNKKVTDWKKLDNAAKIFPPNSKKSDTKVFRFACELYDNVDKNALQNALNITVDAFPLYKSIIKSGLFWYYFEMSHFKPVVMEENLPPCSPLYDKNNKTLLFRVMYYKKRISFEVYHALSDGAGALQFFKTLVFHYIIIKYEYKFKDKIPHLDIEASVAQKMDDSFQKYYSSTVVGAKKKNVTAYKLRGMKIPEYRISVIEGIVPVDAIIQKAKEYNTSLTIFLAAILMCAINEEIPIRHKKRSVVLSIPVNLRNYFYSETARNFFGVINVSYNFASGSSDLREVIEHLKKEFEENLTEEILAKRINNLSSLEHNFLLRAIPLGIKDIALKIANSIVDRSYTSTLSNVGKVVVPDEIKQFISSFDIFVSTNKLQACVCSYENKLRISFTSAFVSTEIQRRFFKQLTSLNLPVIIESNIVNEE
ncbi:hypothetical protein HZF24_11265 [Sedimentibacter hydroxybenzoicus DSM 7310]|uniref:Alcohol acetyltransferase n=1 Tax=Sedimentibacter hydroxybenzoicus DSM 7310 TaxID=1123245 RepID=A0A974BK15_SEDHY|nr:hypothetical protein [Sedimentibacter hydroxybenzoicus]NYB74715.1 hypothetical protein [Sedimentibacter hydroxybenzoicus DSM 7310]